MARAAETLSTALEEYEPNLAALVDVVVPEFADWCAVDVVEADGTLRRLAVRHGAERGDQCSVRFDHLLTEWPTLAQRSVVQGGAQLHWSTPTDSAPGGSGGPGPGSRSYLIAPIRAREQTFGIISCVTDPDRRGYRPSDLTVAEELAGRGAITVERVLLYREVKNSAQASERAAGRWRALIEATPAGIVEVDLAGRIVLWNRFAATMFGWPDGPDTSVSAPSFPVAIAGPIAALWARAVEGKKTLTTDVSGVVAGSQSRDLTVSAAPLVSAGGTVEGILTLAVDVTERKLLEEGMREAQRMEAIGQVAGGVAHDFNNLLTVITGYTDLVRRKSGLDESSREMLEGISEAAEQAAMLTGQLLTIGRRQEAKPVVLEPNAALRSLADVLARILGIDIALRWSLDAEAGNIHIDPARFEQLILNLAINGRDAMPAGGCLEIGSAPASLDPEEADGLDLEPGRYVRITVADTGIGMDDETRRRCFEAFFTTKDRSKGTGLGLAAVHGIVAEGSGAIAVSSELGQGTRFDIYLPTSSDQVAVRRRRPGARRSQGGGDGAGGGGPGGRPAPDQPGPGPGRLSGPGGGRRRNGPQGQRAVGRADRAGRDRCGHARHAGSGGGGAVEADTAFDRGAVRVGLHGRDNASPRASPPAPSAFWPSRSSPVSYRRGSGTSSTTISARLEAVADAPDGHDPLWPVGIGLDLAPHPSDVLGHRRLVLPFAR